jgi:hypothetical protein
MLTLLFPPLALILLPELLTDLSPLFGRTSVLGLFERDCEVLGRTLVFELLGRVCEVLGRAVVWDDGRCVVVAGLL